MASNIGVGGSHLPPGSGQPRRTCNDFNIGVICALAVEKAAFVAMLDQVYEAVPTPKDDSNSYTFGRIGCHNIVTACLPVGMTGNNSAAMVAKDMSRSFSIKLGLMVGVGGGVWSAAVDIRLGDVVVSQPDGIHGGVVQWDFGKMESGGFKRTGSLNKPPRPLLNAVQDIKTKHMAEGDKLAEYLSKMVQNNSRMAQTFTYQGTEQDYLYEPSYNHVGGDTCAECDVRRTVKRPLRTNTDPHIHYGNIASGNEVIKNGEFRDRIAQEEGVICFEMEAAGLMDNFPCLVIRGICDYADSHKNKRWQPYAAATAAAYAKDLLMNLKTQGAEEPEPAISPYLAPFSLEGVPRVRKFVDRPAEMLGLEQALLQTHGHDQRQKIYVLRGLGGIGKTQLAVEFARRHHRRFSAVFWLDGRNEDSIKRSIAGCASRIPQGQIPETSRASVTDGGANVDVVAKDVLAWLARVDNTEWLLIIDNVDREFGQHSEDPEAYDVRRYLSGADHGSVLITTRLARLEQLGDSHQLGKVEEDQAKGIFESWYKRSYDAVQGRLLLRSLDGLPLAIAQAGAYLHESGLDLEAYLQTYEQQWEELMTSSALEDALLQDYPDRSVWTTWVISYQAVRIKNQPAANLLLLWSFLDNKDIWHGLFTLACHRSKKIAPMLSKWVGDIASNTVAFGRAMQLLCNYSLVEAVAESMNYTIHPVVHRWAYYYQGEQLAIELGQLALVLVGWAVPHDVDRDHSTLQRRIFPHVKACTSWVRIEQICRSNSGDGLTGTDVQYTAQRKALLGAIQSVASLHADQGKLVEAESIYLQVLAGYNELIDPEYFATLNIFRNLGSLYRELGKLVEAERMLQKSLEGYEVALGPDHDLTLDVLNTLGQLYINQGKVAVAEHTLQRALQGYEATLGPDETRTLQVVNNLGSVYLEQGNLVEAENMFQRALQGYEAVLEPNHVSTLKAVTNLGILYAAQNKLVEAERLFERSTQGYEAQLGHEHMSTLGGVSNLGNVYLDQGRMEEAEDMYKRALAGFMHILGEDGALQCLPGLYTIENLGDLYAQQGRLVEAEALFSTALSRFQSLLGPTSLRCKQLAARIRSLNAKLGRDEDDVPPHARLTLEPPQEQLIPDLSPEQLAPVPPREQLTTDPAPERSTPGDAAKKSWKLAFRRRAKKLLRV